MSVDVQVLVLVGTALSLIGWPTAIGQRAGANAVTASAGTVPSGRSRSFLPQTFPRSAVVSMIVVSAIVGTGVAGLPVGAALGAATATGSVLVAGWRRDSASRRDWSASASGLRMLARELRSGTAPAAAATAVASALAGPASAMFDDLAAAARLGIDRALPDREGPAGVVARQLRAGLQLALVQGIPLAELVEATATDVDDRIRAGGLRASQVAGPRFSGYVLAALPLFGLLLGGSMGAHPLAVLFGPAPGSLLLPVGVALACAGLLWSARIVRC